MRKNYFRDINNCRKFFEEWAAERGIDTNNVLEWYGVDLMDMEQKTGGLTISLLHGGFKRALQLAYPEHSFRWHTGIPHLPPPFSLLSSSHAPNLFQKINNSNRSGPILRCVGCSLMNMPPRKASIPSIPPTGMPSPRRICSPRG